MTRPRDIETAVSALEHMGADVSTTEFDDVEVRSASEAYEHFRRTGLIGGEGYASKGPSHPYESIEAIHACVTRRVNSIYQLRLCVGTDEDNVIESGPIADLIDKPNPDESMRDLMASTAGWLLLQGDCKWVFPEMIGRRPTEMIAVPGALIKSVFAGGPHKTTGKVIGYKWRSPGESWATAQPLELDEVWPLRMRSFNADQPFKSLSVVDVIRRKINQVFKADLANERSLDNDCQFSGVMSPEDPVTEEQWKEFVSQVRRQHQGAANRNRLLATSRKINIDRLQATFDEMEFTELMDRSVNAICVAFGYDPAVVGYVPQGGIKSHISEVKDSAWLDVDIPFAAMIADEFQRGVISRFESDQSLTWRHTMRDTQTRSLSASEVVGTGHRTAVRRRANRGPTTASRLFVWFDDSSIAAVKRADVEFVKQAIELTGKAKIPFATLNERYDWGFPTNWWHETATQTLSEQFIPLIKPEDEDEPVDELPEEPGDETGGETGEDTGGDTVDAMMRRLGLTQDQLLAVWQRWRASFSVIEKRFGQIVRSHYKWARKQTLTNLNNLDPTKDYSGDTFAYPLRWIDVDGRAYRQTFKLPVEAKDVIGQILFDLVEADNRLLVRLGPLIRTAYQAGGNQTMQEAADATGSEQPEPFRMGDTKVSDSIRSRDIRITKINTRVTDRIRASLAEGINANETFNELAARIRTQFNLEEGRAKLIAFQETSSAVETARQLGREQADVPLKSWLWSQKPNGRDDHRAVEATTMENPIARDADFDVSGESAQYPRDARLSAEQSINCGCTTLSRYPNDNIKAIVGNLLERGFVAAPQEEINA